MQNDRHENVFDVSINMMPSITHPIAIPITLYVTQYIYNSDYIVVKLFLRYIMHGVELK